MNISLGQFERRHGVNKGTASRKARDLGFDTAAGLTDEAYQALLTEFGIDTTTPEPAPEPITEVIEPEVLPEGFWQSTALAPVESRELSLPEGFDASAMIRHFDGVMGQATDTSSLVAIAKLAITAADTAMDQKLSAQRQALTQAEQHQAQLAAMVTEAQTNLKIKALESKMIAERQTSQTRQAEQVFAELMSLGKPAAATAGES